MHMDSGGPYFVNSSLDTRGSRVHTFQKHKQKLSRRCIRNRESRIARLRLFYDFVGMLRLTLGNSVYQLKGRAKNGLPATIDMS